MKWPMALLVFHPSTDFGRQSAHASWTSGLRKPRGDVLEGASRVGDVSQHHAAL